MKTLFDYIPTAIDDNIVQKIANLHIDCLVSFLVPREHHKGKYSLVGTGFFIYSSDSTIAIIMTARHVLEHFDFHNGRITIDTVVVDNCDIGIRHLNTHADLAKWEIPSNFLIEKGMDLISTLPTLNETQANQIFEPMDSFILLGYPSSRNAKLDFRDGKKPDRQILGLALHQSSLDPTLGIRIFQYNGKGRAEAWRSDMTNPTTLNGMSGSPCLRIVIERSTGKIGVLLAGVFYSWNKQTHALKVVSFSDPWHI